MLRVFSGRTADDVWQKLAFYFKQGTGVSIHEGRGGKTEELLHVAITIEDPKQRWVVSRTPAMNPAFALAEVAWIMNGSKDAAFINHWNPILPKYAGYCDNYHGAYGYRLRTHFGFDQLEKAFHALKKNPSSRQVVLQIWDPRSDLPNLDGQPMAEDIPCNVCSILKIRDKKLEWLQIVRSNDLFRGVPHNFVQFTSLQEIVSGWLGIEVGSYNQISDSLHVYLNDKKNIENSNPIEIRNNSDLFSADKTESDLFFSEIYSRMHKMVEAKKEKEFKNLAFLKDSQESFQNLLFVIAADSARRRQWDELSNELMINCTNRLYKQLWENWLLRRKEEQKKAGW